MADPLAQSPPEIQLPKIFQKYKPIANQVPTDVLSPLVELDLQRARKGQAPMSQNDTAAALRALLGQPTPQPKPSLWQSAIGDIEGIVQSIPHLPGAFLQELKDLPNAGPQLQQALQDQSIKEIAQVPGIRMLPGSFVASHGLSAFREHPVLASLDIAPALHKGVEMLPENLTAPVRSQYGEVLDKFGFGPKTRETARTIAQTNRRLTQDFNRYAAGVEKLQSGLTDEQVVALTQVLQRGDAAEIAALPKDLRERAGRIMEHTSRLQQSWEDAGFLQKFDNEYYPIKQAQSLQAARTKYWNAVSAGDDVKAEAALNQFRSLNEQTPPARFRPLLDEQFRTKLSALAQSNNPELHGEAWKEVQDLIQNRFYNMVPNVTEKELSTLASEVSPMWTSLKEAGADPVFIHEAPTEQLAKLRSPKVFPGQEASPMSVRELTWNQKPGVTNFAVGLNHMGYEFLQWQATNEAIAKLEQMFGTDRKTLFEDAVKHAERTPAGPGIPKAAVVENYMAKDYVKWDPESIFPWRKARATTGVGAGEEVYMPKTVRDAIEKMYPKDRSELARLWDTSLGVFRVGILPLSPRWHLYNIIGGLPLMLARTGPSVFKYMEEARQMIQEGRIPAGLSQGIATVPEDVRVWNFENGQHIGKMIEDRFGIGAREKLEKVARPGAKLIQKSYDLNEMVDDMYRTMSYLYGKNKAIKAGESALSAEESGIKLANKVLQDWDSMVPFERQVMRSIFPFYGWMRHILSYVMTYPWDHPWRASIVANFARNEMEDWNSGIPTMFKNYLFPWGSDIYGNTKGINVRGMNPFADVSNYFTLAGLVSQLNPAMSGIMQAMGFNPRTATAQLYPTTVYNPDTGRLEAAQKNPVKTVLEGFFPQAAGIQSLLHFDDQDIKNLKLTNPEAYRSRIFSSLGLPSGVFPPKKINPNLEIARAELARNGQMQDTLSAAIRTGDFSKARTYPKLKPIVDYLMELEKSGALDKFRVQGPKSKGYSVQDLIPLLQGGGG